MMKDWLGFSAPYRLADLVAVDMVNKRQAWARVAGQEKIIHTQQRHIAMRYLFRPSSSGSWNVQLHMISHSMPEVARWTGRQGTVVWHEDGLEMITVGTDAFHRPDGTLRDAATHSVRRFIRAGDELRIKGTYSYYDFLTSPSGARLPVPDFSAPLLFTSDDPPQHAKFPIEYESRPPSAPPKAFFEETKESPRQP